ncbi:MAG: hypothetical protein PHE02_10580 [Lachnospiraceae bacterium]|nr:hypothetical protein [Lachnospiraceae bacterium]
MDKNVVVSDRIPMIHKIEKYVKSSKTTVEKANIGDEKNTTSMTSGKSGKTLVEGYINRNNQKNCGCTGKEGNHEGQKLYRMKCLNCGFEYEANGCDVWLRKCLKCQ